MRTRRAAPLAPIAACALAGLLVACTRTPTGADAAPAARPADPPGDAAAVVVTVTLSEAAARVIAVERETVTIDAEWFGYPTVAAQQRGEPGTEQPWLSLHRETRTLEGAGRVRFRVPAFAPDRLALIEQGRPHLLVEVAAGGDDGQALLDCGTFQDRLSVAVRDGVGIDCRLVAE